MKLMKALHIKLIPLLLLGALGCAPASVPQPPPSRGEVASHLGEIAKVEEKQQEVQGALMLLLMSGVELSEDEQKALREHSNMLYIYLQASYVALASGDMPEYRRLLKLADGEVTSMMEALLAVASMPPVEPSGTGL